VHTATVSPRRRTVGWRSTSTTRRPMNRRRRTQRANRHGKIAEPSTGGEAFVPKYGNYASKHVTPRQAAGGTAPRSCPAGAGGGGPRASWSADLTRPWCDPVCVAVAVRDRAPRPATRPNLTPAMTDARYWRPRDTALVAAGQVFIVVDPATGRRWSRAAGRSSTSARSVVACVGCSPLFIRESWTAM